jgi:hypothetical protein
MSVDYFLGVFAALVRVVLSSPAGGLPALESGYWLPLTGYTASGIMIAITFYSLSWEIRTFWFATGITGGEICIGLA